jgi:predicted lipoprotein with Yx(FWY)xxD motif
VSTASNPRFGVVLVDATGDTLYTLTNAGKPVDCTDACTSVWPPLLLPAGASIPTAADLSALSTVAMNGGMQITARGDPLYRYSGDSAPGDTNGNGIASFGGIWHVAGTTASAATPTATPTTTSSGLYGG